MKKNVRFIALFGVLMAAGCASVPSGPSGMALPGTGKSFDAFRADDYECRQYASMQAGGSPERAAEDSGARSAALGTVIGAAAGAAFNGGHGAAVGAGTGLLVGSLAGTGAANASAYTLQERYDAGYMQCMYAKGDRIPVSGRFLTPEHAAARAAYAPPPPPPGTGYAPPPPPGTAAVPPPPPPSYR